MKRMRVFTDDVDQMDVSIDFALKRIEKLPLPYTGNKKKLIFQLHNAIKDAGLEFNSIIDAFSGSGTVSYLFKLMGKNVISNDILTSSYLNSVAFVENPGYKLTDEEKEFLLKNDNPNKGTFVEDNYCGENTGKNIRYKKFTIKECRHLDNFRANIDELCGIHKQGLGFASNAAVVLRLPFGNVDQSIDIMKHRIKQQEEHGDNDRRIGIYYDEEYNLRFDKWFKKYLTDFTNGIIKEPDNNELKIKRACFLANLQQHVLRDCMVQGRMHRGQALAELDIRLKHQKNQLKGHWSNQGSTEMDFFTQSGESYVDGKPGQGMKWWNFTEKSKGNCVATNMDVTTMLQQPFSNVDAIYFDPPYGGQSSNYSEMYRFLEEYIYSDVLESLPHIQYANKFVKKRTYEDGFVEMLEAARHIPIWMFSYNDTSWKDINYICNIIKQFKTNVNPIILADDYRYLYRKSQGRDNRSSEYLIIAT